MAIRCNKAVLESQEPSTSLKMLTVVALELCRLSEAESLALVIEQIS